VLKRERLGSSGMSWEDERNRPCAAHAISNTPALTFSLTSLKRNVAR
jgi:hypothetical protein